MAATLQRLRASDSVDALRQALKANPGMKNPATQNHPLFLALCDRILFVMFAELFRRLPDLELAGPVARLRSNFINGIKSMPVRFTPEA